MSNFWRLFFILQFLCSNCTLYYDDDNTLDEMINEHEAEDDFHMLISGGYSFPKSFLVNYVVSLRTRESTTFFGDNHYCAGTIIASRFVLTAGQCLVDSMRIKTRPRRVVVLTGVKNRLHHTKRVRDYKVKRIFLHPHFKRYGVHNIAIIELTTHIKRNADGIRIVGMHQKRPEVNTTCTAAGWGKLVKDGPYAALIVYLNLQILPHEHCEKVYGDRYDSSHNLCAHDPYNPQSDACVGDMGGPLICAEKLSGVISWSLNCGTSNNPLIVTDVSSYEQWILDVINAAQRSFILQESFLQLAVVIVALTFL